MVARRLRGCRGGGRTVEGADSMAVGGKMEVQSLLQICVEVTVVLLVLARVMEV